MSKRTGLIIWTATAIVFHTLAYTLARLGLL
jgi:hypothetical protein